MKKIGFLLFWGFSLLNSQKKEILNIKEKKIQNFYTDAYNNLYYQPSWNHLYKFHSDSKKISQTTLNSPYILQNVENPLHLYLFSENKQEIKVLDPYLNEIQNIDLKNFNYIEAVFVESLDKIWLWDTIEKKIIQYNFAQKKITSTLNLPSVESNKILNLIVSKNHIFLLTEKFLTQMNLRGDIILRIENQNTQRIKIENQKIYLIQEKKITSIPENEQDNIFFKENDFQNVDKNYQNYFGFKEGIFYIYPIKK